MGHPTNYSVELPARCLKLLDELWEPAGKVYPHEQQELGPLRVTFLLSMAVPIIGVPIERIYNHIRREDSIKASDDRNHDAQVVEAIGGEISRHSAWRKRLSSNGRIGATMTLQARLRTSRTECPRQSRARSITMMLGIGRFSLILRSSC
jgi:hypothetical protein